jgi:hypothetical protein
MQAHKSSQDLSSSGKHDMNNLFGIALLDEYIQIVNPAKFIQKINMVVSMSYKKR